MNPEQHTFWHLFKGGMTTSEFVFSYFLVFLGLFIYTLARVINRKNQDTKISLRVWFNHENNSLEMIMSFCIAYLQIIFAPAYEEWFFEALPKIKAVPYFIMVAGGYGQHFIIVQILKWNKK